MRTYFKLYNNGVTKAKVWPETMEIEVVHIRHGAFIKRGTFFSLNAMDNWLKDNGYWQI